MEAYKKGKLLFPSTPGPEGSKKSNWLAVLGENRYNAYLLAKFDPIKAEQIYYNVPTDRIAEALVSMRCYEYVEPKKPY